MREKNRRSQEKGGVEVTDVSNGAQSTKITSEMQRKSLRIDYLKEKGLVNFSSGFCLLWVEGCLGVTSLCFGAHLYTGFHRVPLIDIWPS